jgi:hypothetical protein|tara:strand:+ start:232 stop:573 length:342 start_codon:yes stop_codon:yes gene_type:complete
MKKGIKKIDKRVSNGGHSTKSLNPNDGRKNQFKEVMNDVVTREDLGKVFRTLFNEAIDGNMQASKLLLEYSTIKPTAQVEIKATMEAGIDFKSLIGFGTDDDYTIDINNDEEE